MLGYVVCLILSALVLASTSDKYRIDTGKVVVGGFSAGAFTALHTAYVHSESEILDLGGTGLLDHVSAQGGLEGSSGNAGYSSAVHGVFNIAGALGKASMLNAGEPALFSVHGTEDEVVPIGEGDADGTGVVTQGSVLIHQVADAENVPNLLKSISGGDHGAFDNCSDCAPEARKFFYENLF